MLKVWDFFFSRYFPEQFWSSSGFTNRPFSILTFFYPFDYSFDYSHLTTFSATEKKARKIFKCVEKRGYDLKHRLFWKLFLLWLALQYELVLKQWLVWTQDNCVDVDFSWATHNWVTPEDGRSGWDNKFSWQFIYYVILWYLLKKYSERSLFNNNKKNNSDPLCRVLNHDFGKCSCKRSVGGMLT